MLTPSPLRFALPVVSLILASVFVAGGVHAEPPPVWSQRAELVPPNGEGGEYYGVSVAISGGTAVVGDPFGPGKVHVFLRNGTDWQQQGDALGSEFSDGGLGFPCAIFADTVMCGNPSQGTGYAFERAGSAWSAGQRLVPTDTTLKDWGFTSLSIYGDTALVGVRVRLATGTVTYNPPGVYVFERSGGEWVEQTKFSPNGHAFGLSVALFQDTAALTANEDDGSGGQGLVYLYERTPSGLLQTGEPLRQPDSYAMSNFGWSTSLDEDTLVASGKRLTGNGAVAGAAYVFVRTAGSWSLQATLEPAEADESFAGTVSVSGDTVAIAAKSKTYFFWRSGTHWQQLGQPLPGHAAPEYNSVALSGQYAVAGLGGAAHLYSDACSSDTDCPATAYCLTGTCHARCQHDSDCASESFCPAEGICAPQRGTGFACDDTIAGCREPGCAVCSSGHCVDGVCCESACAGTCEACAALLTAGANGACLPIPASQDLQDECAPDQRFPESCLGDGSCDGRRACNEFAKAGTACGETSCGAQGVAGHVCDGKGTCHTDTVSCGLYACSGDACASTCASDKDCASATSHCQHGACTLNEGDAGAAGAAGSAGAGTGEAGAESVSGAGGSCEGAACAPPAGAAGEAEAPASDPAVSACGCRLVGARDRDQNLVTILALMFAGFTIRRFRRAPIRDRRPAPRF
jgi:hypothetical protein